MAIVIVDIAEDCSKCPLKKDRNECESYQDAIRYFLKPISKCMVEVYND